MKRSLRSTTAEVGPVTTRIRPRVVLLGASNLTRGIGVVLETARRAWGRPLEVVAALGRGRSYGRPSSLLGRQLPGILECGLWQALARTGRVPTAGLVTDIGNDLLYEEPVERIVGWIEKCLDRLAAIDARTVVTLLPLDNLRTLSGARFTLMRAIFFPRSGLGLEAITERAHALNDAVERLAIERGFRVIPQRTAWYGFDPVHIKLAQQSLAWREILAAWHESHRPLPPARGSLRRTLYLQSRVPDRRRVLGFEQRAVQPSGRLRDGTTVAIY